MAHSISTSDLRKLDDAGFSKVVRELEDAVCRAPNGEIAQVELRLREFEARYELPSADLDAALREGKIRETREIGSWLMLIALRDRLATVQARSR